MIAFIFSHEYSRENDPNLHFHVPVFNITSDGKKYRAISNEKIHYNQDLIMKYAESKLFVNLQEQGIASDLKMFNEKNHAAVIPNIPESSMKLDSTRSETVKEIMREKGIDTLAYKETLIKTTRRDKESFDRPENERRLIERQRANGTPPELLQKIGYENEMRKARDNAKEIIRDSLNIITNDKSVFTKEQVLNLALFIGKDIDPEKLSKTFDEEMKNEKVISLENYEDRQLKVSYNVYTTAEMKRMESQNLSMIKEHRGQFRDSFSRDAAIDIIRTHEHEAGHEVFKFTKSQSKAIEKILTSENNFSLIQGDAGTGKTEALKVIAKAYAGKGYEITYIAPTGIASEVLSDRAVTIDKYLADSKGDIASRELAGGAASKTLFIVDECSMIGTKKFNELLNEITGGPHLKRSHLSKIILSGDIKQIKPIGQGKDFVLMIGDKGNQKEISYLKENIRQKNPEMKKAVEYLAEKSFTKAEAQLDKMGAVREIRKEDFVRTVTREFRKHAQSFAVIASTNERKNEVNAAIREERKRQGELKNERYIFVKSPVNMTAEEKIKSSNYEKGYDVKIYKTISEDLRKGDICKITGVGHDRLTVQKISTGRESGIVLSKDFEKYSVYENRRLGIAEGDKVQFLQNDIKRGIRNGMLAEVIKIEDNLLTCRTGGRTGKKDIKVNMERYNFIEHSYAMTFNKTQGQTFNLRSGAIDALDKRLTNFEKTYVGASRFVNDMKIYTEDKKEFYKSMQMEHSKQTIKEHEKDSVIEIRKKENIHEKGIEKSGGMGMEM